MPIRTLARWAPARWREASPWAVDAIVAGLFLAVGLLSTSGSDGQAPDVYERRDALAFALIAASTVPFVARRRAPVLVFVVATTALAALMVGGYNEGALPLVLLVGAYTVGAYRSARDLLAIAATYMAALVIVLTAPNPTFAFGEMVSAATGFGTVALLGWSVQSRRLRLEALEREQQEASQRAAADERLRIAQELHDVVAHSLGVIAVQAGVGLKVVDADPAEARRALDHISQTSRSSLGEIRRLLGLVRSRDDTAYAPPRGLADVPRLVQDMVDTGLPVDLRIDGDTAGVPPGVELAAYRIVQEALTNALRHAHATRVGVRIDSTTGVLRLEVTDNGVGANGTTSRQGHGLVGMRERVAMYRGTLEVGPRPDGGFAVAVSLPYEAEPGP